MSAFGLSARSPHLRLSPATRAGAADLGGAGVCFSAATAEPLPKRPEFKPSNPSKLP